MRKREIALALLWKEFISQRNEENRYPGWMDVLTNIDLSFLLGWFLAFDQILHRGIFRVSFYILFIHMGIYLLG